LLVAKAVNNALYGHHISEIGGGFYIKRPQNPIAQCVKHLIKAQLSIAYLIGKNFFILALAIQNSYKGVMPTIGYILLGALDYVGCDWLYFLDTHQILPA
jgi:hypothetical protein